MRVVALLGLLLAVAGCAAPADPEPVQAAEAAPPSAEDLAAVVLEDGEQPAVPTTMEHRGCRQYHMFFAAPWETFNDGLPEGFGPDGTDPTGTFTTVYVHTSWCTMATDGADAIDVAESWIGLRVTPPPEMARTDVVLHAVPLDLVVASPELASVYRAWGLGDVLREGTVTGTDTPAALGRVGHLEVAAPGGTYLYDVQLGPPQEGSAAGAGRVFVVREGAVAGWFDYSWPSWTDLGLGNVLFRSVGNPDAPPLAPGSVHQVEATDVTFQFVQHAPSVDATP